MAAVKEERWSRGCGSGGLGPIGSLPDYRYGVLEGNWNEDVSGVQLSQTGRGVFDTGVPPRLASTMQEAFNEEGKSGAELAATARRVDRELHVQGQGRDVLMRHGDFRAPPVDTATSLYSLTYGQKQLGEPRVQSYLWSGVNRIDATVPTKASELTLTKAKVSQWVQQSDCYSGYETTSNAAALTAATAAAANPAGVRRGTLRPGCITGNGAGLCGDAVPVGRKPVGPAVSECDKNYRRVGLRDTYCTFLTAPKQ